MVFAPGKGKKEDRRGGRRSGRLQFAAAAAEKGHEVSLWERGRPLAASILLRRRKWTKATTSFCGPVRYLEGECRKAGVQIELGSECSPEMLADLRPGRGRYRNGCRLRAAPCPALPRSTPKKSWPGARGRARACSSLEATAVGVRDGRLSAPDRGVSDVTIVEASGKLGRDVSPFYLWRYLKLFKERGRLAPDTGAPHAGLGEGVRVSIRQPKGDKVVEVDDRYRDAKAGSGKPESHFRRCAPEVY